MYLVIVFVSPLSFVLRKKWGAFLLNSFLYLLALFTILFGIGFFFWALALGHAAWHLRTEVMQQHARMIAQEMAKEMNRAK
jgi:hypothetical protein